MESAGLPFSASWRYHLRQEPYASKNLQERRKDKNLTQEQLARLLKSSQSRVAKMERGDPSVSLDLLVRSMLVLGESRKSLARILSGPRSTHAG